MSLQGLQTQRCELKYIIPEKLALEAREFVRAYLDLDAFGASQADLSYPVHSLYLDSPDYELHRSTINGDRNRYKLRIRFYEYRPNAPVYFEIKRREDNSIYKERCAVVKDAVEDIGAGRLPLREHLVDASPENERAMLNFSRCLNQIRAVPVAHVSYRREAWSSTGSNRYRITFDRAVTTCPEDSYCMQVDQAFPVSVFGSDVVLELKFTGRFPTWMRDMVQVFGLMQCSAAKYVDGVVRMEEEQILCSKGLTDPAAVQERRATRGWRMASAGTSA